MARFAGEYSETFTLDVPIDKVEAHFGDLDQIVKAYAGLKSHEKLDDKTLRFRLEPKKAVGVTFHGQYDCKYEFTEEDVLTWKTVNEDANIFSEGRAEFTKLGDTKTKVKYRQRMEMEIPVNRLVGKAISPIVKREIEGGVKSYLDRMRRAL